MKKYAALTVMFAVAFTLSAATMARAEGLAKVDDSIDVLKAIEAIPEKGIPPALLGNANGIAIIPNVIKAGFILGGRYGTGVLLVRNSDGSWSNPAFVSITGGSVGWQIGVQGIDIILVFKSSRSIDHIMTGKFTLGADASIAAGPVGREASAATDVQLKSEIYSYSRSRGLFAGISLAGAVLHVDEDADGNFYGVKDITAREIFRRNDLKVPEAVDTLKHLLKEYSSR
jgi:lipid-binding SYLF domain-containing protein